MEIIIAEIKRIKENGATASELHSAKEFIRGNMRIELEDSSALSSFFGEQALFYPKIMTPDDYLKKMDHVTLQEILAAARTLFVPTRVNLVMVGENKNGASFKKMLEKI